MEDESGAVLALFALWLPVMLLMLALVVDGASWFADKRKAQAGADAAALAAAAQLPANPSTAQTIAQQYAGYNVPAPHTTTVTTPYKGDANKIEVRVQFDVVPFFAKLAGIANVHVGARAVAKANGAAAGPVVAYAHDANDCNAVKVPGDNNTFPALWSNGGFKATGTGNTALTLAVHRRDDSNCFSPNADSNAWPPAVAPPLQTAWPVDPYPPAALLSSCTKFNGSIGNLWTLTHPPGVYCTNDTLNDAIGIGSIGASLTGYTFIASRVNVTGVGNTFSYAYSDATRKPIFFARTGNIIINKSNVFTGDFYAPSGTVRFNGDNGAGFSGFMEGNLIEIEAKGVTFYGTGPPISSTPSISLEE